MEKGIYLNHYPAIQLYLRHTPKMLIKSIADSIFTTQYK